MSLKLMGKKRGMIQLFDQAGNAVPCTVIEIEPNVVTQIKTHAVDGYTAIQLGYEKVRGNDPRTVERRSRKPQKGHFAKANVEPRRHAAETRVVEADLEKYQVGQEIGVDAFEGIAYVDVVGRSKGKGYQGVMKLHGYSGGPAAHGSGFHRHAGSTGMRSTPGRCLPGGKRPSHMGDRRCTVQSLQVVKIVGDKNVLIVKGQVPGARNSLVYITPAIKRAA